MKSIKLNKIEELKKKEIINFEYEIKKLYEDGKIKSPIHLSGDNEDQLISIFRKINRDDWVISSWRNHYHALLHGISKTKLKKLIMSGKSMRIISKKNNFYSSSIVGGGLSIGLGIALGLKMEGSKSFVYVFIGDMTFETGVFHEAYKYAKNFKLPIKFIVEDNNMSTNSPTDKVWKNKSIIPKDVIYYKYKRKFPHHGTGSWVLF
jgi:TPP-dependent pyruvate/acetoin dehydrogenase alpha subunit